MADNEDGLAARLARNVRQLRQARGLTQQQMATMSGLPRATWASLESGAGNPTVSVLHRVSVALQAPIEELISTPRAEVKHYPLRALPTRTRGSVTVRTLLPDKIPGMLIERIQLPARTSLVGVPHTAGTREYLACEAGTIDLAAAGERWRVTAGDVVVFRGDQRHSYANTGGEIAVGYSFVMLQPVD